MNGLAFVLAAALSVAALALFLWRCGLDRRLGLDAAAAGACIAATLAVFWFPFALRSHPMRVSPQAIAFLVAGLPEEALKMLAFVAFLKPHWRARTPRDVMLAAAALGLGFAALENFLYVAEPGADWARVAVSRAATAAPMHVMWGIAGGFVVARAPSGWRGVAIGVLAWGGLAALHGVYDFGYFAAQPDAVPTLAFDAQLARLGFDRPMTLALLADGAEALTALAAVAALRALPGASHKPMFGAALAAALIACGVAVAVYGSQEAFAADQWLPLARWLGFALPPLAIGLPSLARPAPRLFWRLAGGVAVAAVVAAAIWGPTGLRTLDARRAQAQGARFFESRDFDRAAEAFTREIAENPDAAAPLMHRASAYAAASRYDDALADLGRAMRLAPSGAVYAQRAFVQRVRHQPLAALADLDAALALDPVNATLLANRAQARLESGDADGASADIEQARALAPDLDLVHSIAAVIAVEQGDFDAALRDTNARLHDAPADRQALFQRGRVWFYKGEYGRARDDFAAALAEDSSLYAAIWRALAQNRLREGASDALKARLGGAPDAWPAPVARMLLGLTTPEAARAAANSDDERCEADFYFAASRLGEDASDVTAARLHAVLAECPTDFIEYEAASAELKRLAL